jgi:hypothetical protein
MPFRDYSGFNDAALKAMTAAYDAAISKLEIQSDDPRTSNLAAIIAALASEGERDPAKLCDLAMAGLSKKQPPARDKS